MTPITIPKKITKGEELVVIPKKEYKRLLGSVKNSVKKRRTKVSDSLEQGLKEALEDVKAGRMIGPFSSAEEGLRAL